MSPQKIALVTLDYPPEKGGVARYLGNLVDVAQGRIEVFVNETHVTTGPGIVKAKRFFWHFWPRWLPLIPFFIRLDRVRFSSALVSHVLPVGTAAWMATWVGGISYSILLHGLDVRLALASRRRTWILKRVLKKAEQVFVNSQFVAQEVRSFCSTIQPIVVTPGVEPLSFPEKQEARQRFRVQPGEFILLCVARLVPRKGIDRIISLLSDLPSRVRLVVIGNGSDHARLQELAQSFGARVTLELQSTDEERNAWYAASDAFIFLPREQVADVEGFGIVCLEAAAAGLPVIVANSGGAAETVESGVTGYVVDPEDRQAILAHIRLLIDYPEQARALGQAGKARAERDFRWEDRWKTYQDALYGA